MHGKIIFSLATIIFLVLLGVFNKIKGLDLLAKTPTSQNSSLVMASTNPISLAQPLVNANTKFAFKLFSTILMEEGDRNVFVSPTSVAIALSMTYNGATGETQQAIAQALELQGMTIDTINSANQALQEMLFLAEEEVQLCIANSLWAKQGVAFKPQFLRNNQRFYHAKVTEIDFARPEAINIINGWVREKTRGKIDRIVEMIKPSDVLFLINAIYFKGNWTEKFDKNLTTVKPFYSSRGREKPHPMMSRKGNYLFYENDRFQAVSLPYGDERLSMYIFLPRKEYNLNDFFLQLTPENWKEWMYEFSSRDGFIQIPRFKLEYEIKLNRALEALGMGVVFDGARADFSAMTSAKVKVDGVKHKTFLEVNEEGAEAAAVTSLTLRSARSTSPFTMTVDRPFFCVILDNDTGAVLFMGAIFDPQ